jgi:hypothetical protein
MFERASISAAAWCTALAALLSVPLGAAKAFDDAKYPNLKGQWTRLSVPGIEDSPSFDPTKRSGLDQQAPLTPEYRKIYEAGLVEQAAGGRGTGRSYSYLPSGMPMVMQAYEPMEIIVAADAVKMRRRTTEYSAARYDNASDKLTKFGESPRVGQALSALARWLGSRDEQTPVPACLAGAPQERVARCHPDAGTNGPATASAHLSRRADSRCATGTSCLVERLAA